VEALYLACTLGYQDRAHTAKGAEGKSMFFERSVTFISSYKAFFGSLPKKMECCAESTAEATCVTKTHH